MMNFIDGQRVRVQSMLMKDGLNNPGEIFIRSMNRGQPTNESMTHFRKVMIDMVIPGNQS
ncbi:hypothetical protein [Leptospira interrogans]|uniref:hypothetical protein n=1 Tax=Leptospira interrogans TaxID=173 RepID=UPI0017889CDA|nr:hypothetical protein [Leptospira interrogans]